MTKNIVAEFLETVTEEEMCFLAFRDAHFYVALRRVPGQEHCECLVSAGRQVSKKLSARTQQWLYERGFRRARASEDFLKVVNETSAEVVFNEIKEIFQVGLERRLPIGTLTRVSNIELDNTSIQDAMVHLAKARDWAARKTLYRLLIDGWFVVPVDEQGEILLEDTMGQWPVCGVYLDRPSYLRRFPTGQSFECLQGWQLFPRLVSKPFGSMRINPKGEIRGELYLNELQMIRDGMTRLEAHQSRMNRQEI